MIKDSPDMTKSDRLKDWAAIILAMATLTTAATGMIASMRNGDKVDRIHQRIERVEDTVDKTSKAVDAIQ